MKQLLRLLVLFTGFVLILSAVSTVLMLPLGEQLPKSERLAFLATRGDNDDIYVMDMARSLITPLTRANTSERFPTWSPDGGSLAYHSGPSRQPGCTINYEIFIASLDGQSVRQITGRNLNPYQPPSFDGFETVDFIRCAAMPDWSPDGTKIAFHANPTGQWDIFVYNLVTNSLEQVTDSLDDDVLFDWAPDSVNGVYATGVGMMMSLNRVNTETGEIVPLTSIEDMMTEDGFVNTLTGTLEDWHPTYSPDGAQIVFMSDRSGSRDLYVMNADGTNLRNITPDSFTDSNPVWTADGRIIFTSDRMGVGRLFVIDPDTGDLEPVIGWNFPYLLDGAAYWSPEFNTPAS